MTPKKLILDKQGNIVKSCYIAKTRIYGTQIFATLEEAKTFVANEALPKVWYAFYDFKDERYYSFVAYEEFNLAVC